MGTILWHAGTSNFREYLSIQLSSPMQVGTVYDVSFYLTAGVNNGNYGGYGTDQISVLFTSGAISQVGSAPIPATPQLTHGTIFYSNSWQLISFQYTATAAYDYITIGNFQNDAGTNTQFFEANGISSVYYFLDEVSVTPTTISSITISGDSTICAGEEAVLTAAGSSSYWWADASMPNDTLAVNTALSVYPTTTTSYIATDSGGQSDTFTVQVYQPPVVNLGNDTTLCQGDAVQLDATTPNATYLWQDNSTNPTFNIIQQGVYWVEVTVNNCTAVDSITVNYNPLPIVDLGSDTSLCVGETLLLDATAVNATYLWQDNSTNPTFNVTQQATYWVEVASNNCTATDSITVSYNAIPTINLGNDTTLCQGQTLVLDATTVGGSYAWQDNSTSATFNVSQQGIYWVEVTVNNCTTTDSIIVNFDPAPVVDLGNDTSLCQGESLALDATAMNATYLWQDNSTNPTFNVVQQGTYWVEVTSNNCATTDSIIVTYNPIPTINLGNDTTLCQGQTLVLDATTVGGSYLWQDNSTNPTFDVNLSGTYWVELTVNNCTTVDSIDVNVDPTPTINLGSDTTLCEGEALLLDATTANASYVWQDN